MRGRVWVLLSDWGVGEGEDCWAVELAESLWSDDHWKFTSSLKDKSVSVEKFAFVRKFNCSRLIFGIDMVDFVYWFREGVLFFFIPLLCRSANSSFWETSFCNTICFAFLFHPKLGTSMVWRSQLVLEYLCHFLFLFNESFESSVFSSQFL